MCRSRIVAAVAIAHVIAALTLLAAIGIAAPTRVLIALAAALLVTTVWLVVVYRLRVLSVSKPGEFGVDRPRAIGIERTVTQPQAA